MTSLCKVCIYYNQIDKTCTRSVGRENKAKYVRLDKKLCGPSGKWFGVVIGPDGLAKKALTPVEVIFDL